LEVSPFLPYKLLLHRPKVEAMLRGELVYPISVELDLSNKCPHDCQWCSFGTSASQGYRQQTWVTFPSPRIFSLLDELKTVGVESVTFTGGGEPLVHPEAYEILSHATKIGLQWGLVTNGLLLRGAVAAAVARGATFVRVSLDAGSDATHMVTHGIRHPQYQAILRQLGDLRNIEASIRDGMPRLAMGASFCVMDANWKEIRQAAIDLKANGANYLEVRPVFPTDWRGDGWTGGLSPANAEAALHEVESARAQLNDSSFKVIGMTQRFDTITGPYTKPYSSCHIGPLMTVIGADARIWWCCVQRGQKFFEMGDVSVRSFREVWAEIHAIADPKKIDIAKCPRCRYDGFNQLIEQAFVDDGMHRSFV